MPGTLVNPSSGAICLPMERVQWLDTRLSGHIGSLILEGLVAASILGQRIQTLIA
jgi:hypothetical protein